MLLMNTIPQVPGLPPSQKRQRKRPIVLEFIPNVNRFPRIHQNTGKFYCIPKKFFPIKLTKPWF